MNMNRTLIVAGAIAAATWTPAHALEGNAQAVQGILIGASAGVPPPGIYGFNQVFSYQANLTGPGTTSLGLGNKTGVQVAVNLDGFLFVPGWTFLGATYDAVVVVPFAMSSVGSPVNAQASGMHNTYIAPVELAWKLGNSGFAVKTGLGMFVPDGTQTGANGLGNQGAPYWTFTPEVIVSYLKDGYNLSAAIYAEINTRNTVDQYKSGSVLHADFTATKAIGKWTVGPVAYYVGQVSNDNSPIPGATSFNAQRYNIWSVGGLVGYDFGAASLSFWLTKEVYASASNAAALSTIGIDPSLTTKGFLGFATLSYRIWAPDEPGKNPLIHK